jgi:hypothetical protein
MKNHTWHPNVWHELQLHGVGNLMKWPYRLYIYWNETLYTHTHTMSLEKSNKFLMQTKKTRPTISGSLIKHRAYLNLQKYKFCKNVNNVNRNR